MTTRVVNVRHDRFDVYIGRACSRMVAGRRVGFTQSFWANPWRIGADGTRGECIARYRHLVLSDSVMLARLRELRGKVLGCWCAAVGGVTAEDRPHVCHGQVLAELADEVRGDG